MFSIPRRCFQEVEEVVGSGQSRQAERFCCISLALPISIDLALPSHELNLKDPDQSLRIVCVPLPTLLACVRLQDPARNSRSELGTLLSQYAV